MVQFPDLSAKTTAANDDILPIRDVSSGTDKKTTVSGLSAAVAATLPAASVKGASIDFTSMTDHWAYLTYAPTADIDYSSTSMGDWYTMGSVTVPAWATKARIVAVVPFTIGSALSDFLVRAAIGTDTGQSMRLTFNSQPTGGSYEKTVQDVITLTGTGAKNVKIQLQRYNGSGFARAFSGAIRTVLVEFF